MKPKPIFPYKTLIWALFALVALFLFKRELSNFLMQAEGVSVFGVEITASKEKVEKLHDSIQSFETTISDLSNQLTDQQERINDLDELKTQLQQDLAECPEAKKTSVKFNQQVSEIFDANQDLKLKSSQLINTNILNMGTFDVKLVLPSKMIGAEVFVDGKKANIIKKSGVYVMVKIIKKNSSHSFEIKQGTKNCSTDRLITKDGMEVPIVCDF